MLATIMNTNTPKAMRNVGSRKNAATPKIIAVMSPELIPIRWRLDLGDVPYRST